MKDKPFIIVAENNSELRWLYRNWLEKDGFAIIEAEDGAWMLAQMEPNTPDLVLIDLHLPYVNCLEVCQRLKSSEQFSLIPIIATTAFLGPGASNKALHCGADALLIKPISRVDLITLVHKLLGIQANKELDEEIFRLESRLWAHLGD